LDSDDNVIVSSFGPITSGSNPDNLTVSPNLVLNGDFTFTFLFDDRSLVSTASSITITP